MWNRKTTVIIRLKFMVFKSPLEHEHEMMYTAISR